MYWEGKEQGNVWAVETNSIMHVAGLPKMYKIINVFIIYNLQACCISHDGSKLRAVACVLLIKVLTTALLVDWLIKKIKRASWASVWHGNFLPSFCSTCSPTPEYK